MGLVNGADETLFLRYGYLEEYDRNGLALYAQYETSVIEKYDGWLNTKGEYVIAIPSGWQVMGEGEMAGIYTIHGKTKIAGFSSWFAKFQAWITGEELRDERTECRTYDKEGNLIWSSADWSKMTKAWMWVVAAVLPLLVSLIIRRRSKWEKPARG